MARESGFGDDHKREGVLIATMAQLDFGQCGHLRRPYAEAISTGAELSLSRRVPRGKETARALKELMEQTPTAPAMLAVPALPPPDAASSTRAPTMARFAPAARVNGAAKACPAALARDKRHLRDVH